MAFVVVYDANVLYGNTVRDLLIRIAQAGMVQAKWTHKILDEMLEHLAANRPDIPPETIEDVLDALERAGLVESAAALRDGRYAT
ncbi:MAG: hypothetical protein ACJ72W_25730 [Actinoallomurus sp.]